MQGSQQRLDNYLCITKDHPELQTPESMGMFMFGMACATNLIKTDGEAMAVLDHHLEVAREAFSQGV
jgi:hypothetical protein